MNFLDGTWVNPPPVFEVSDNTLTLTTGAKTDFWQRTLYGFQRDDGHFLAFPAPSDFDAVLTFEGAFDQLYDQAGFMLRQSETHWIKAGVEFSDGVLNFSVVVTNGTSDWSVQAAPGEAGPFTIRVIRVGAAVVLHRKSGNGWQLMRLAAFPEGAAQIGPMACTPERAGLSVKFRSLQIDRPPKEPLHLGEN